MLFSALNNLTRSLTNTKNLKFQVARFFKASNELFILFYFFYCMFSFVVIRSICRRWPALRMRVLSRRYLFFFSSCKGLYCYDQNTNSPYVCHLFISLLVREFIHTSKQYFLVDECFLCPILFYCSKTIFIFSAL